MNKRNFWLIIVSLIVTALLLGSCGQSGTTTTKKTSAQPTTKFTLETPQYGGTITTISGFGDPMGWDPTKLIAIYVQHMQMTSNELMQGDWTKGPQGTHKTDWEWGFLNDITLEAGELAESWETPDDTTIIYKINKNAKYQNKAPANGRAVTAQDVVWNMEMQFNYPTAWEAIQYPPSKPEEVTGKVLPGDSRRPTSFKALDQYTVEVKVPSDSQGIMLLEIGDNAYTNPPECWVGPDAKGMTDWRNVVGSGPWIVSDYVSGSSVTYTKNQDYWEIDPLYPGKNYRWPYADSVVNLIITDRATQLSAFRTGKVDFIQGLVPDDAKPVMAQNKDIRFSRRVGAYQVLSGRMDKENLPFKDKKVRYALNIGVDKQEIVRDYWKGEAEILAYPYAPSAGFAKMYTPVDQLPKETQELFTGYSIEKAKQLLKDAGYPNGFKTKVQVANISAYVDECAMLKNYLKKINVDLEIEVMEVGAWNAMDTANSQDEMWYGTAKGIWNPAEQLMVRPNTVANDSMINDPYFEQVGKIVARDVLRDPANYFKVLKESGVYELGTAWGIWMPVPYSYNLYWPWLKNYEGIWWTGWAGISDYTKSIWIDKTLKKSMGY